MAERKSVMDDSIVQTKGDAKPVAMAPPPAKNEPAWKQKTPITVRLDDERYRKLTMYSAQHVPRKTHQEILVEALDLFIATRTDGAT